MPDIAEAKAMARRLRDALAARGVAAPHALALELVASQLGFPDWNTAAAALAAEDAAAGKVKASDVARSGGVSFLATIPILRIFDEARAREFYCDFLGFSVRFEHRFALELPLYMEVARAGMRLHLSEHHGDASPGSTLFVPMQGVRALHRELLAKQYKYNRPGLETLPWGEQVEVHDPFGNRIRFCEQGQEAGG